MDLEELTYIIAMCEKNASLEPFTTKKGPENALNIAVDLNLALQTLKRGLEVRRMHRVQVLSLASPKPFNSASALTPLASKTVHCPMQNHFAPIVYAIWRPDITLRMYTGRYLLFISLTKKYEIPKVVVRNIRNRGL